IIFSYKESINIISYFFCFAENDDPVEGVDIFKEVLQQIEFGFQIRNVIERLSDRFRRRGLHIYFYFGGERKEITCYLVHQFAHCSRKEKILSLTGYNLQNSVNLGNKTHIHHFIGLIQYQKFQGSG